ncbi:TonB-dependent receptor [Spirosoma pomorum]
MTYRIRYILSSWLSLIVLPAALAQSVRVSGYVYDAGDRQPLVGVSVSDAAQRLGTTTNERGFFSLAIPDKSDEASLTISLVGYTPQLLAVPTRDTLLTISLVAGNTLEEVVVTAPLEQRVSDSPQMSQIVLSVEQINKVPAFLGERDVIKAIQLLPGVQKSTEGNAGIYVRGGGPDQNLILLDGATIYNPNHLLGFFSAFNSDALGRVEFIKGGFPARYGGRVSSVIELETKTGNSDSLRTDASVGILASRVTLDGPLAKGKIRYVIGARRTYLDLVTRPFNRLTGNGASALQSYFYDINGKAQLQLDVRNSLSLSAFYSRDRFTNFSRPTAQSLSSGLNWANTALSFRWKQILSEQDIAYWGLFYSQYKLAINNDASVSSGLDSAQVFSLSYRSGIQDVTLQYSRELFFNNHELRTGAQAIYHRFTPDAVVLPGSGGTASVGRHYIDALESSAWLDDTWKPTDRWRFNGGLRLNHYALVNEGTLGVGGGKPPAGEEAPPGPGTPAGEGTDQRKTVQYFRLEPRFSAAYILRPNLSLKGSYSITNQFVHLLSSTGIGLPADLWIPTTDRLKPQQGRQVAIGIAQDLARPGLTITAEAYHKDLLNLVSYREGASFLSRNSTDEEQSWADNVTTGRGWSSGLELLVQKKAASDWLPRWSGWVGYTLSRTRWQFAELNGGRPFYPRYDRRHDASVVLLFDLSPTMTLGSTWVYGSGNALTLPLSRFSGYANQPITANPAVPSEVAFGNGPNVKEYGDRNGLRAEPYHRLDISWQIRRQRRTYERTWAIGAYNVYNRRNPFYYSLEGKDQGPGLPSSTALYRYSVFSFLPSVSYSIKF